MWKTTDPTRCVRVNKKFDSTPINWIPYTMGMEYVSNSVLGLFLRDSAAGKVWNLITKGMRLMALNLRSCPRIALALLLAGLCSQANAEWQYKEVKVALDPKIEKLGLDFNSGRGGDAAAATRAIEQTVKAYIARFTLPYDQATPRFDVVRRQLDGFLNEGTPRQPPAARRVLVDTIVQEAGKIIDSDEYSPAARINCAIVVGELDEARDASRNIRKPSASARDLLLQSLSAPTTPIYLKVVFLQGLDRQARESNNGWDDAVKQKVVQAAAVYANSKPDKDSPDRQASAWLTRRGLDVLRNLRSKEGVDSALGYLGDPEELPSLRLSALQYLFLQDLQTFSPEQKKAYVLGNAHFLRSQLISWYYAENDRQKRATGGTFGGGMGPGGMGPGGTGPGGLGPGGMGGDGDSGFDPGGGFGGAPTGPGGRGQGAGGRGATRKPIETQTWEARLARRRLNQITQNVRFSLEGKRVGTETSKIKSFLTAPDVGISQDYKLDTLIEQIDKLQSIVNDHDRISSVQSLMSQSKREIEAIMRFTKDMPGFLDRYSELGGGDEELQEVEPSDEDANEPAGDPRGDDGGGQAANQPGNQGGDRAGT